MRLTSLIILHMLEEFQIRSCKYDCLLYIKYLLFIKEIEKLVS